MINPTTKQPYAFEDYFAYALNWTSIAPTTVGVQATAQINSDSDFIAQKITFIASSNQTLVNNPILTWMLTDAGSNKNLFNTNLWLDANAGNGQLPFMLPINRIFQANSVIQGTLFNLATTANTTYDYVQIQLHGVRGYLK